MPSDFRAERRLAKRKVVGKSGRARTPMPQEASNHRQLSIMFPTVKLATAGLVLATAIAPFGSKTAQAATYYWNTTTTDLWSTGANWSDDPTSGGTTGVVPTATDFAFLNLSSVTGNETVQLDGATAIAGITFANTGTTTLSSNTTTARALTLGAGGITVNSGAGAATIGVTNANVTISLNGSQSWANNSSSLLTIFNAVTNSSNSTPVTLTLNGSGSGGTTINGVISDNTTNGKTSVVVSTSAGTTTLSGANSFTGGLTIQAGTALSTAAQGFGAAGGSVSIGAAGTATVTLASDLNVNNIFTGNGILTVTGSTGTPNFTNASALNGFTGTFNVNTSGSKKVALTTAGGNIGSGATVNVASGATLYISNGSTFSGVTFNLAGAGNSENLGALRIENGTTIGATSSIVLGGNTQLGGNGAATTVNAVISETGGSRSIEKVANNIMTFAGNNTYTGATILTGGTLSVSTDSAGAYNLGGSGTNGITFNGGALRITGTTITNFGSHTPSFTATKTVTLDIADVANNFTVSQVLNQTTGQLIKLGAGTLTSSGANTYSGGTRANAGTLVLSGSHTKAAGTTDFLSVNNVGAQNAVLKVTAGTHGFTDLNLAEATNARGAIYQSGGDLTMGTTGGIGIKVGSGATSYGYYNLSGGTLTLPQALDFQVGGGSGATGVMDVSGGSVTTASWLVLGRNGAGNGLLNVTGGSVTSNSNNIGLNWANTAGSLSILNVGGGAGAASVTGVSNAGNYFDVSQSATTGTTGVANLRSNGTLTVSQVRVSNAGSTALFNFNGGTLKANALNAGANFMNDGDMDAVTVYTGGGTIDNNGTSITIGNALRAATGNGVTSIAVTDGGSGYIGAPLVKITGGTGNSATGYAVMADDGTGNGTYRVSSIVITSPGTYSVDPTAVTLTGGGASTVATLGSITSGANTSGGMSFTGTGTTTLSGANTYTGVTTIVAGKLLVNGTHTGAGAYTVASGGTLGGTGAITTSSSAGVTVLAGGKMAAGGSAATGKLTMNLGSGSLDISGAEAASNSQSLLFRVGTTANSDNLAVTGTLIIGTGTLEFDDFAFTDIGNIQANTTYTLIDASSITGSLGSVLSGTFGSGVTGTLALDEANGDLLLDVAAAPEPQALGLLALGGTGMLSRRRPRTPAAHSH